MLLTTIIFWPDKEVIMKHKFIKGVISGIVLAFPLGINFGKDVPLLSNPFTSKPDITAKMIERTNDLLEETRGAIHSATMPTGKNTSE